jgi:fucose 4-O-acetylase-like acetyltransferase
VEKTRLAWPDATRALGVVAVVVYHTLIWNYNSLESPGSAPGGLWSTVDAVLGLTRMPVLFALSGLLTSAGLLRGWRRGTALRRSVSNYYLYVIWLVAYFVLFSLLPTTSFTPAGPESLLTQLVLPNTTLWFIFALALYPLVILGLRALRVPVWAVFVLALILWNISNTVPLWEESDKLLRSFLFFAVGVYGGPLLRRVASARWPWRLLAILVFVGVAQTGMAVHNDLLNDPLTLLTNLTAIPAAIAGVSLLCRWAPFARVGSYIGSKTLRIYVLHIPVLAVVSLLTAHWSDVYFLIMGSPVADHLYPLVTAAVITALCLLIGALLDLLTRGLAFALPRRIDRELLARQERGRHSGATPAPASLQP